VIVPTLNNLTPQMRYYGYGKEYKLWISGYMVADGNQSKELDHLSVFASKVDSGAERTYVTHIPIPLKKIKTLYIDWSGEATSLCNFAFCVSTSQVSPRTVYEARILIAAPFTRTISSLDVSALTGEYYLRVHSRDTTTITGANSLLKIYHIWGDAR